MSLIKLFQGLDKTVLRTQCLVQSEYRQVWIKQSLLMTDGLSLLSQLLVEGSRACHLHLQVLSPSLENVNASNIFVSLIGKAPLSARSLGNAVFSIGSIQFSHSVVSESLRPHELQHARPPCPSPTPGVHSNSCPSSW